jgi:hypothetical protein
MTFELTNFQRKNDSNAMSSYGLDIFFIENEKEYVIYDENKNDELKEFTPMPCDNQTNYIPAYTILSDGNLFLL